MTTHHTLYRFFDKQDRLLYVGRTINPRQRWRDHEKKKSWFNEVVALTREVYPTAEEVDQAERYAIATEGPLYNIALNPNRRFDIPLVFEASKPRIPTPESERTHAARLLAAGVDAYEDCLEDETFCECSSCHGKRLVGFEDLHSKYFWHPSIADQIEAVEKDYYAGQQLSDWYYDYYDIEFMSRMHLAGESKSRPMPALVEIENSVAQVDCPFCFRLHRHFLPSGANLDRPLEAGCATSWGAQYFLLDDWLAVQVELQTWAAKQVAA